MRRTLAILLLLSSFILAHAQETKKDDARTVVEDSVTYDADAGRYLRGTWIGTGYLDVPDVMTPEEYHKWAVKQSMVKYYKKKNEELFQSKGANKFDFTDMHFDLGPAEKIFGPGGVRIKTQGSAEIKLGANMKKVDNPSLATNRRKTFNFNFDEKINLSVNGKVGDKIDLNLNYNTEATFDYDAQNMKLKYDGKEDEIIKLIEAGNVSFPTNMGLVSGVSSLFGVRTDLQFGKLKMQTVISQKKSASKSVSAKGRDQLQQIEISALDYEENRHFFLAHFFRDRYDQNMRSAPNITSGVTIKRIELWVTNKTGQTTNNRNIVAFTDLGEPQRITNPMWRGGMTSVPSNKANTLYSTLANNEQVRDISTVTAVLDALGDFEGGRDYDKLQSARKLNTNEYTLNAALGYVSLNITLQSDEVLCAAYEYTYNGQTFQVGEFATDMSNNSATLMLKTLKSTTNSPTSGTWNLMMKNIYYLGTNSTSKDRFRLDIKYQSDSSGVYLTYLPEANLKQTTLLKALGLDRLDANNKANPNGQFDYIEGYTISKGRIIFPVAEPFGDALRRFIADERTADKYCYDALYDSTKTVAKQMAEQNKFWLMGQYKGNKSGELDLGATNIARGSVHVTAGGVELTENTDYTVDYSMGRVTIINQSILDAGTNINASVESNDVYGMQRKTFVGLNLQYDFSKELSFGGTFMFLNQQSITSKVTMGNEPLKNLLWGVNLSWKKELQWLTKAIDWLPLVQCTAPSQLSFQGEFAQLVAGQNKQVQGEASYIDDFENTKQRIPIITPSAWMLSSVPQETFPEGKLVDDVRSGMNRALLAWYYVDPLFTRRSSTLTPSHIKGDITQLSNHYVREVYERELYPNKSQNSYSSSNAMSVLNLAFYPSERGAYNLSTDVTEDGKLLNPTAKWGGMMRKLETNDFDAANIEYMEFWVMDPFIYKTTKGGDLYINLGEISEDVLHDGKKFFESGMPVDGDKSYYTETNWGRVPTNTTSVTYAFNTTSGSRRRQDTGLNGLTSTEEKEYNTYANFLAQMQGKVNAAVYDSLLADPASDDYHYYRGTDYDNARVSILDRYKRINLPEGNSPSSEDSPESYETAYKTTPDVEDINGDYTLNEYERYFQYRISIRPEDLVVGQNYITDKRTASVTLRNGESEKVNWYQFRVPVKEYEKRIGSISDFTSVRFARIYMTGFDEPIILRFATLDLVASDWRPYEQAMGTGSGSLVMSAVNIEENNDKTPVNYVLPPGISRVTDPTQSQLAEENEQALALTVKDLAPGDARAVYKNSPYDMRQYKHLQMFVHANALLNDVTALRDGETSVFLRLGSDYKNNYYEYEVPLTLTPEGNYDTYSSTGCRAVWPIDNMIELDFAKLTALKKERNALRSSGMLSYYASYEQYDSDRPNNKMTIMGNPSLGEVKTIMIGVRNNGRSTKSVEVWVNEMRLQEFSNDGGWAAQGTLNLQLSDLGSVNVQGHIETAGFGGIEQTVAERSNEDTYDYNITTSLQLGKLLPEKAKLQMPFYYNYRRETIKPLYNPLDTDMKLSESLDALATEHERDSLRSLTTKTSISKSISLSGVKFNYMTMTKPMPWDPACFSFSYSHSHDHEEGETTAWEDDFKWRGSISYSYSPKFKAWEPFKKSKKKSKWFTIVKELNFNYLPQSITFDTDMNRTYYELQERDLDNTENMLSLPMQWSQQWLWNRSFNLKWDLTKNLHLSFQSQTHAEVAEPYTPLNKDLYPDAYTAWKDSVKTSLRSFGDPLTYQQTTNASYKLPLEKLPCFDFLSADATYQATYNWTRGNELEDGSTLGNNINTQRTINGNVKLALEKLYNHSKFLQEANKRFSGSNKKNNSKLSKNSKISNLSKNTKNKKDAAADSTSTAKKGTKANAKKEVKGYASEVTMQLDSATLVKHGQKSKKIRVTAQLPGGKRVDVKYKKIDDNSIAIQPVDSTLLDSTHKLRVNVVALPKFSEKKIYTVLQGGARFLMMLRNVNLSYRNTYNLALPGFLPNVGDMLGQRKGGDGLFRPGLDFAFGTVGDSYIDRARDNGWLLCADSVATPATSATTEDLQIKATLEPFKDFKIDLTASRTANKNRSMQYMYVGCPTTETGSFNMTVISIKSAFQSTGSADNNYRSTSFTTFIDLLDSYQRRVEELYAGMQYPDGIGFNGDFDPANGTVDKYSADVMVPAFLAAYTGGGKNGPLDLFPALARMRPNWTLNYKGLGNLPWLRDHLKSVTLTHGYKSVFAIGSYNTFSSFVNFLGGGRGFVENTTTGTYVPSSMYDISTVSINESFSPLIGLNVTMNNNMTFKAEYKKTRVLTLSMTNAQINETSSNDIVFGWGWKINDFKFSNVFGKKKNQNSGKPDSRNSGNSSNSKSRNTDSSKNSKSGSSKNVFSHDLNLRFDFSLRDQSAINRDIQTGLSEATSGSKAIKASASIDYTMSRYVTLTIFYDRQRNSPLLTNNGYPTITQDFGFNMKFSLTR